MGVYVIMQTKHHTDGTASHALMTHTGRKGYQVPTLYRSMDEISVAIEDAHKTCYRLTPSESRLPDFDLLTVADAMKDERVEKCFERKIQLVTKF